MILWTNKRRPEQFWSPAKPAFPINGATTTTQQHNSRWELGMIVFQLLGGRGSVGVRGMIVFNRLGGRGSVGVRGSIVFNRLGGRGSVGSVG